MSESPTDRPPTSATADVALITRALTVTASVDASGATSLVVRPEVGGLSGGVAVRPGDLVEVYWAGADEERSLPARVAEVGGNGVPTWHLTITGPSGRSQRRKAVRAAVALPVVIPWAGGQATGATEDLSEAGLRARVDGWGLPPDPGTTLTVLVTLDDDQVVSARSQVVRVQDRGGEWVLSVGFRDLPDADADRLRRRVFSALREERAAEADD
jgi:hypothetical protein